MQIGGRSVTKILTSVLQKQHYIAASNMVRIYERPLDALGRYLLQIGNYPETIVVLTPIGRIPLRIYSHHDMLTVNEIFCRLDYMAQADDRVVVDFGSNIGISAAYFLTRSPHSHVYLYEPLDVNVERLHKNLQPFDGRYTLHKAAIALGEGEAEFGWEESGRYGGIGIKTGNYIRVKCLDSNEVLKTTLAA